MAFEENGTMMTMPVSPMYGGNGNGMFGDGNSWAWIILLLLLVGGRGWGNGYGNDSSSNGTMYPWMNQMDQINSLGTQICNGFAGVNATTNTGFANAETAANARQMATMQEMNQLASQFANCCCENRLASANLQNIIQTENCADRAAVSDGVRDIIASQTAGFQRVLDQMCNDKIDAKNEEIANLRTQLNMANLAASQGAQTAQIISDNNAQTAALIQRIAPYPVPSWNVQNPYAYVNNGCGCGCNA